MQEITYWHYLMWVFLWFSCNTKFCLICIAINTFSSNEAHTLHPSHCNDDLNNKHVPGCSMVDLSKWAIMQNCQNESLWTNSFDTPIWAEWTVCLRWIFQKDWSKDFHFGDFACQESLFTQINHWMARFIYFAEIIIAMRGGLFKNPNLLSNLCIL